MRVVEMAYNQYEENPVRFHGRKVRDMRECTIWSTENEGFQLVLDDPKRRRVTLFDYETAAERHKDIKLLLRIDESDGGASEGVPAWLTPTPPARSSGFEEPIPEPTERGFEDSGADPISLGALDGRGCR